MNRLEESIDIGNKQIKLHASMGKYVICVQDTFNPIQLHVWHRGEAIDTCMEFTVLHGVVCFLKAGDYIPSEVEEARCFVSNWIQEEVE